MKKIFMAAIAAVALFSACEKPGTVKPNLKTDIDTLSYALGIANSPSDADIKNYLMQAGADSAYVQEFIKGLKEGLAIADNKKEMAYQLGMQTGMQMKTRMFQSLENQVFAGDSTQHLSTKYFLMGFNDGHKDRIALTDTAGTPYNRKNIEQLLMTTIQTMTAKANEKVYGEKKKASEEFMTNIAKEEGVKPLAEGVYYKVINEGKGAIPTAEQTVEVEYEGRLIDGKVFDASQGKAVKFPCNAVIKGWTIALTHMPVGSEWEVYIPWNLAYGESAQGPIPPYSTLIFKMKLVSIAE